MNRFTFITTVTPATSYDLVVLADVKEVLGITGEDNDDELAKYITRNSAAAANFCNRKIVQETILDEFWPARDPWPAATSGALEPLQLTRWPIVSVTSVVENAVTLATDGTDYRIDNEKGCLIRMNSSGYPCRWPAYALAATYVAGYATIPSDIQDAVIRMVCGRWYAKKRDPYLMSETIPGVREARWWIATGDDAGNMPPDVQDLLNNYRQPVIAA
jgi:gp6-like head-tail connector protein